MPHENLNFNSDEISRIYTATNVVGVTNEPFRKRSRASVALSSLSRCSGRQLGVFASSGHTSPIVLYPAVDFLGLHRSGSWSQIIYPPQDFPKQVPRHRNLGQLERDIATMEGRIYAGRKILECPLMAKNGLPAHVAGTSGLPPKADIADGSHQSLLVTQS